MALNYTWTRGAWQQSGTNNRTPDFYSAQIAVSLEIIDGGQFGYPGSGDNIDGGEF